MRLVLTVGGGAHLEELEGDGDDEQGELVWSSDDDAEFQEEFDHFLTQEDVFDILDYLEEVGELTRHEADQCDVVEEFYDQSDMVGVFR